jgi:RNA polymerase sigma-70 factor (ECF subfamily)
MACRYDPDVVVSPRLRPALRLVPREEPAPAAPRPALPDDAEIVERIKRGDTSAASALYLRARPAVDKTVVRLLGRRDVDHDDLVQVSMVELARSLPSFRGECSLDTWVSRVTAHTVFKELRRRKSERRIFERPGEDGPPEGAHDQVNRGLVARSLVGRVRAHLDAMDPAKATAVVLHDVCGYDLREVAQITESTVAAAQTRLVRGRADLHARISSDPSLADLLEGRQGKP